MMRLMEIPLQGGSGRPHRLRLTQAKIDEDRRDSRLECDEMHEEGNNTTAVAKSGRHLALLWLGSTRRTPGLAFAALLGQPVFWTKRGWMTPIRGTRIDIGETEPWLGKTLTL
jgi:hypothetical protein